MKNHLFNSLLTLFIGALFVLATPIQGQAQWFRLAVNEIRAAQTSDSQEPAYCFCGPEDEIYFTVAGTSNRGTIALPRVAPAGQDHFDIGPNQSLHNIPLWDGHWFMLADGETAYFTVLLRNRKNAFWGTILSAAQTAGAAFATFLDPSPTSISALQAASVAFVNTLTTDGDKTLGAFTVRITNQNHFLKAVWKPLQDATFISSNNSPDYKGFAAQFQATGQRSLYDLHFAIERYATLTNINSGKCLDLPLSGSGVPGNGAWLQQFTCNGGANQAWVLRPMEDRAVSSQYFMLINGLSNKCLDLPLYSGTGSYQDGVRIQQYTCNGGSNQNWYMEASAFWGEYRFRNKLSNKMLEVRAASTADGGIIQQFTSNSGANQKWRIN